MKAPQLLPEEEKQLDPTEQKPYQTPPWLERMLAADIFEQFLGVPPGGHRDPSPGEARPRWPNQ